MNIDTGAAGYAQVGILDGNGHPIPGYSTDECVYINGDYLKKSVEWMQPEVNLAPLEASTVQLEFRMRGTKLYAMQFVKE